jgi:peptidoglycan/LPS O-acetylase OafA/YrhL
MKTFREHFSYPILADDCVARKPHDACPRVGNEPEAATPFQLGYRRWLDGLRGLAILSVLAFHLHLLPGGSLGVDIFFVLSGFLITALLAEEWQRRGSISLKAFYLRRSLRLLPAFLTLLLLLGFSSLWIESADEARARRAEVIVAGCYIANWPNLHRTGMPTLGHTWSLSVEEQFYLLWPVLFYGMLRLGLSRRQVLLFVCTGIVASALHRMVLYDLHRVFGPEKAANVMRLYMGLDTRADTLLVGCLLGLLVSWDMLPRTQRFVFWVGIASLVSVVSLSYLSCYRCLDHSQYYHGLFTAVALMVGVIIVRLLSRPSGLGSRVLESAPFVGAGRISYALYLFHIPIISWLRPAGLGWRFPATTLLVVGLTLASALLSYCCIERPCLRLKDRMRPRAATAPVDAIHSTEMVCRGANSTQAAA